MFKEFNSPLFDVMRVSLPLTMIKMGSRLTALSCPNLFVFMLCFGFRGALLAWINRILHSIWLTSPVLLKALRNTEQEWLCKISSSISTLHSMLSIVAHGAGTYRLTICGMNLPLAALFSLNWILFECDYAFTSHKLPLRQYCSDFLPVLIN